MSYSKVAALGRQSRVLAAVLASIASTQLASAQISASNTQSINTPPPVKLVAHALRRISFGVKPGQATVLAQNFPTDMLAHYTTQLDCAAAEEAGYDAYIQSLGVPVDEVAPPNFDDWKILDLAKENVARGAFSENQLCEVMTKFWQDHFNTGYLSVRSYLNGQADGSPADLTFGMVDGSGAPITDPFFRARAAAAYFEMTQNRAFRENALGTYKDLLRASALGPAMLIYLDSHTNKVFLITDNPNENYARELLELHCLGVSDFTGKSFKYSETDIEDLAQVFTGASVRQMATPLNGVLNWEYYLDTNLSDDGGHIDFTGGTTLHLLATPLDLTNSTGQQQIDDTLDFLAGAPETARHVSRKLIEWFVGFKPVDISDPDLDLSVRQLPNGLTEVELFLLLNACEAAWGPDGDIRAVVETILTSAPFANEAVWWGRVKTPFDAIVSTARNYSAEWSTSTQFDGAMFSMELDLDQDLFRFPSPDGFPIESDEQLSTSGVLYRVNAAQRMHRDYKFPDPTGVGAGFQIQSLHWNTLEFYLPDLLNQATPNLNYTAMVSYLSNYQLAVQSGYFDLGSEIEVVKHVLDSLYQGDWGPGTYTRALTFLQNIPAENIQGDLQSLVLASDPVAFPGTWFDAFTELVLRLVRFKVRMGLVPQSHQK